MELNKNFLFALVGTIATLLVMCYVNVEINWSRAVICFFAWMPYRIGKHHYSLFGGFSENNCYSLFGLFQKAGVDALQDIGFSLFQIAGDTAWQSVGISLYQKAKQFSSKCSLYIVSHKVEAS